MVVNVICIGIGTSNGSVNVILDQPISVELLKQKISLKQEEEFYLCHRGIPLCDDDIISVESGVVVLTAHYRVCGGKGGFGSLIRATGSHINRSSDKSACRDLSGRRMRDIKKEKQIAEWVAGEKERKRERREKRKRKLQKMMEEPKHKFEDLSYMEQIRSTEEGMADSLKQGLSQASKIEEANVGGPLKKPKLQEWTPPDLEDLDDSDLEDSVSGDPSDSDSGDELSLSPGVCVHSAEAGPSSQHDAGQFDSHSQDEACPTSGVEQSSHEGPSSSGTQASPGPVTTVSRAEGNSPSPVETDTTNSHSIADPEKRARQEPVDPVDLSQYFSVEELVGIGGERLKVSLQALGLKCGGTPLERAQRLFSTKGKSLDQLPPSMFAKNKNGKSKKR